MRCILNTSNYFQILILLNCFIGCKKQIAYSSAYLLSDHHSFEERTNFAAAEPAVFNQGFNRLISNREAYIKNNLLRYAVPILR